MMSELIVACHFCVHVFDFFSVWLTTIFRVICLYIVFSEERAKKELHRCCTSISCLCQSDLGQYCGVRWPPFFRERTSHSTCISLIFRAECHMGTSMHSVAGLIKIHTDVLLLKDNVVHIATFIVNPISEINTI